MKSSLTPRTIEPDHLIWVAGLAVLVASIFLALRLVFAPGLDFWAELLQVIPFMLMGGLCSEAMMAKILDTLTNAAFLSVAVLATIRINNRLRAHFGPRRYLTARPPETLWQTRMAQIRSARAARLARMDLRSAKNGARHGRSSAVKLFAG